MFVQISNPLNGAAYQVLFELVAPAYCSTRQRQAEIQGEFKRVLDWASGEGQEIFAAYSWAADEILKGVDQLCVNAELGAKVQAAVASIPRPPSIAAYSDTPASPSGVEVKAADAAPIDVPL
jgi:hypothetical protein